MIHSYPYTHAVAGEIGSSKPSPKIFPTDWAYDINHVRQVREDGQPQEHESEEQRVVYKSSPTQRAPSEPPEAVPSLSGRQLSADEETLRQRLISAVQRPSGSETTSQLAGTLSLR